jgi:hypothetical protein
MLRMNNLFVIVNFVVYPSDCGPGQFYYLWYWVGLFINEKEINIFGLIG